MKRLRVRMKVIILIVRLQMKMMMKLSFLIVVKGMTRLMLKKSRKRNRLLRRSQKRKMLQFIKFP